jgi:hypothetical protein
MNCALCAGVMVSLWATGLAWAQENEGSGGPSYSPSVDISEFRPAPPGAGVESVSGTLMLTLAYAVFCLLAGAFLLRLWLRSRALSDELNQAKARLDALDAKIARGMKKDAEGQS